MLHPDVGRGYTLQPICLSELAHRRAVTGEDCCERLLMVPFGMLRCELAHTIERKHRLRIQRMLRPQSAILVKRGDAIAWRHILGAMSVGCVFVEVKNRLFGGPVIPRGQRVSLG